MFQIVHTSTVATLIHTAEGAIRNPAVRSTRRYWNTTLYTLNKTTDTPTHATPSLFSTLLMEFHVSPMDRCASMAKIAGWFSVPVTVNTATLEKARNKAMEDQITGNASGGGIHDGLLRSAIAVFSSDVFGLDALRGENTRDRSALNRNQKPTIVFWIAGVKSLRTIPTESQFVR